VTLRAACPFRRAAETEIARRQQAFTQLFTLCRRLHIASPGFQAAVQVAELLPACPHDGKHTTGRTLGVGPGCRVAISHCLLLEVVHERCRHMDSSSGARASGAARMRLLRTVSQRTPGVLFERRRHLLRLACSRLRMPSMVRRAPPHVTGRHRRLLPAMRQHRRGWGGLVLLATDNALESAAMAKR
jgi:hypothetical protein